MNKKNNGRNSKRAVGVDFHDARFRDRVEKNGQELGVGVAPRPVQHGVGFRRSRSLKARARVRVRGNGAEGAERVLQGDGLVVLGSGDLRHGGVQDRDSVADEREHAVGVDDVLGVGHVHHGDARKGAVGGQVGDERQLFVVRNGVVQGVHQEGGRLVRAAHEVDEVADGGRFVVGPVDRAA